MRNVVPLPERAVDLDEAAALLDDAKDRGQPQTRALADVLGGEKRLEHARHSRLVHAAPRVAHCQQRIGSGRKVRMLPHLQFREDGVRRCGS